MPASHGSLTPVEFSKDRSVNWPVSFNAKGIFPARNG